MAKSNCKKRKVIVESTTHISATFNNIIISLTNKKGKLFWSSAGKMGFRGSKKNSIHWPKWQV
jgi:small subunit ribosomal protein S11